MFGSDRTLSLHAIEPYLYPLTKIMIAQKTPIIRRPEKTKTVTGKSEYLFHFTSHPVQEDICYFEGYYKDPGPKAGLHIHKTITEIFTVLEGEFTFHLSQDS